MKPYLILISLIICLYSYVFANNHPYKLEILTHNLRYPWSLVELPDKTLLITEKPGNIRIFKNNKLLDKSLKGAPKITYSGQGGLLDIRLHPDFQFNKYIYLSYAITENSHNILKVTRYTLNNYTLTNPLDIFSSTTKRKTALHHGARLLFLPNKKLLISSGDGYMYRDQAQSLTNHFGKIICVNDDGSIPTSNPFISQQNTLPSILTFGHRNPQGFAFNPKENIIFSHEHGPKGGDELNHIIPGKNYGWPVITYGVEYSGKPISNMTHKDGMEQPLYYWTPSIALSSMIYYNHSLFEEWSGSLMITGLVSKDVRLLKMNNTSVISEQRLFSEINERLRFIGKSSSGELFILTDSASGKLIKISPK